VHSGPEADRHHFNAEVSLKDLYETYLPAFKALVDAGVEAVMGAYNRTNGEPCCGSKLLLVDILRKTWKFDGHVVSDCGAIDDFHVHHQVTSRPEESVALAVKNGCDLNCGCTYNSIFQVEFFSEESDSLSTSGCFQRNLRPIY
jgi:beta-glucosidase